MDSRLWAFVIVATVLAVAPGADTLLVVRNVLTRGRTAALATVAGIAGGCVVHAVLSAVGVSLILVRSAEAFAALKLCGAAYLIALGVQSVWRWLRSDDRLSGERAVGPGAAALARSLLLAALHIGIGVVWLCVVSFGVGRIRPLVERPLWRARLDGMSGAVLIALGV